MKKLILPIVITGLILMSIYMVSINSKIELKDIEIIQYIVILFLVVFGIYIGIDRMRSYSRQEPIDDELTKIRLLKSSSISFFLSLFIWIVILILKDRYIYDTEIWIGTGILSMSVTFVLTFLILKFKGVKND